MEIFIINLDKNINFELIKTFQKKDISDYNKLFEHCFIYYCADKILKNFYHIENYEIEFISNKPFLKSKEKYLSLSHSGKYSALCFSDYDCGIDIEQVIPRNYERISNRMNFPKARTLEDFYNNWTKYESEYKLNQKAKITKTFHRENYTITACSINPEEKFTIYFQTINDFPKLKN